MGLDARNHRPAGAPQPVLLRHQHFHHLSAPRRQGMEFLGVGVRQWPDLRTDGLGEMGQDLGVQGIGLGHASGGPGEVPHLARIDHHHRQGSRCQSTG